jgi:glyoxylase-like metal-dependent hydrolase (beta-lactamase superfamily II)
MDYRIISIGSLAHHELWQEQGGTRTAHATTTLVRSEGKVILVDPGLPPQVIAARLRERSGLPAEAVTDVFLTNFRPEHRWGLAAFEGANWWIAEAEREMVGRLLIERYKAEPDAQVQKMIEGDIAVLKRCSAAPDKLAQQVDLFPLPGYTPGTCGLLLLTSNATTLLAGDAVASVEHLEQGRVLRGAYDVKQAQESFVEAIEIADMVVPGYDNVVPNRTKRTF